MRHGTIYQLIDEIENKLDEISIQSATNTSNLSVNIDAVSSIDDEEDDYQSQLQDDVMQKLESNVDNISWTDDSDNIYLDVTYPGSKVYCFTVPKQDLQNNIEVDSEYICTAILEETDVEDIEDSDRYQYIKKKSVLDSDGFWTDYTMYYDSAEDKYIFIFGDSDIYTPENSDPDWECDTEEYADEWFDAYEGFADEEDDDIDYIESSTEFFDKGDNQEYWYFTTHGVQPGSVPKGLTILEIQDTPNGTYFLTDKVLTTNSLQYYDIKEKSPY